MQTDDFEWDDGKAARNLEKHGVSFEAATFAFDDPHAQDDADAGRHAGEIRYKLTGQVENKALVEIYTLRGSRTRLISARQANDDERSNYLENRRS